MYLADDIYMNNDIDDFFQTSYAYDQIKMTKLTYGIYFQQ